MQALSGACAAAYRVLTELALSEVAGLLPDKPPANEPADEATPAGHPRPRVGGGR